MKASSKPASAYVGYQPGMGFRYVVDETMDDGRIVIRTLGWSHKDKGSLKELNERHNWQNARYQEIPERERDAEATRPTRWYLHEADGQMIPLPEPEVQDIGASSIIRDQLNASLKEIFVNEDYVIEKRPESDDEPDFAAVDDEPDFGTLTHEAEADRVDLNHVEDDEPSFDIEDDDGWQS